VLEHATFLAKFLDDRNNSYKNKYVLKMESSVHIKLHLKGNNYHYYTTATATDDKHSDDDNNNKSFLLLWFLVRLSGTL